MRKKEADKIIEEYKPEEARDYLPLSLASTIIVTGNLRQWRSFIDTSIHVTAQKEIRELTTEILYQLMEGQFKEVERVY